MNKVVFVSKGGNTQKLAEAIAKGANVTAESIDDSVKVEKIDKLFVGGSIYAGKIDSKLREFLEKILPDNVEKVILFGTSAGGKTTLRQIKSIFEPKSIKVLDEEFFCKGSFLFVNMGHPNEEDLKNAEEFSKRLCEKL